MVSPFIEIFCDPLNDYKISWFSPDELSKDEKVEEGIGDYVLKTTYLKGAGSEKLGVAVEEKDHGLLIKGLDERSPAKKAGLQKGDMIKVFAKHRITSISDLKLALFYVSKGSTREIQLERDGKTLHKEIAFK